MFKEGKPLKIIKRMAQLTGFSFISSKLSVGSDTYELILRLERCISWFREHQVKTRVIDVWLVFFMGLISGLRQSEIHAVCRRFVFSKGEELRILSFFQSEAVAAKILARGTVRPSEIYRALEPLSYEVIITLLARVPNPVAVARVKEFLAASHGIRISVSGHDLHACGLEPGPHYQKIFRAVLNAKLDGKLADKHAEFHLARRIADGYKRAPRSAARLRKDRNNASS